MASRNSTYQEKTKPIYTVIYYAIIVVLLAVIILLYKNYRDKKIMYKDQIQNAAMTDSFKDLAAEKEREKALESENDNAQ